KGSPRESQQGSADHRPAMERRRKYRTGAAGDPGSEGVSDLAAARYRADGATLCWFLRTKGCFAELAFGVERRDVSCRFSRVGSRESDRDSYDGSCDRDGELFTDRWLYGSDAGSGSIPCGPEADQHGELRRTTRRSC